MSNKNIDSKKYKSAGLLKFPLKHNSYAPYYENWRNINKTIQSKYKNQNVGILTGLKNNITAIITKRELDLKNNTLTFIDCNFNYVYIFEYTSDLKTGEYGDLIVMNDNGYIMDVNSRININKVEMLYDVDIKQFPKQIKKDILKLSNSKIKKNIIQSDYEYDITDKELEYVLNNIQEKYFNNKKSFLNISKALKTLNKKDLYDKYLSKYKHHNNRLWVSLKIYNKNSVECLFKYSKATNKYRYKPLKENLTGYTEIYKNKLDNIEGDERFFKLNTNYIIKSGTGSGKSTAFLHFVKQHNIKFISIVSRILLGKEQQQKFEENNIDVKLYSDNNFHYGDNIIITPESIDKINNYDFSKYTIFLDEANSIIEHILSSTTMTRNRKDSFNLIEFMLGTCKNFICADADISNTLKYFIDSLEKPYEFYYNTYQNFKNVNVNIINDEDKFINQLRNEEKYILCMDSKNRADLVDMKLKIGKDKEEIKLITSETTENELITLDEYNKIIFSPKIIYGLDSTMSRNVYCYFKGDTINSKQMVQQITRCRNIENVYIFFLNRTSKYCKYDNIDDVKVNINNVNDLMIEKLINIEKSNKSSTNSYEYMEKYSELLEEEGPFYNIYKYYLYKEDCYESNKFIHLINILRDRGFNIKPYSNIIINENSESKGTITDKDLKELIKDMKITDMHPEHHLVKRINEYLGIPEPELPEFYESFLEHKFVSNYINFSKFFMNNLDMDHLLEKKKDDFLYHRLKSYNNKLVFLESVLKALNINKTIEDIEKYRPENKTLDEEVFKPLEKEYKILFKDVKKTELKTDIQLYKCLKLLLNELFDITKRGDYIKKRIGNIRCNIIKLDKEKIDKYNKIYFLNNPIIPDEDEFEIIENYDENY